MPTEGSPTTASGGGSSSSVGVAVSVAVVTVTARGQYSTCQYHNDIESDMPHISMYVLIQAQEMSFLDQQQQKVDHYHFLHWE